MSTWSRDFLGKKHRELLGVSVKDADAAKTTFEEIDDGKMLEIWEKAIPDDPMLLRTPLAPGGMVERLGAAWKAKFGKRAKIPQDLIAAAKKDLEISRDLGKLVPAFAGGADDAEFLQDSKKPLHDRSNEGLCDGTSEDWLKLTAWLFLARPVGCTIRAGIANVIAKAASHLDDKKFVWALDSKWLDSDDKKAVASQQGILEVVGGKDGKMRADDGEQAIGGRDDGTLIVSAYKNRTYAGFRPATADSKSRKKLEQLVKVMHDPDDYGPDRDPLDSLKRIDVLMSEGFRAFADRVKDTPVSEGGFEANPLQSVPKLVDKVAKELGVSRDAAVLYLQTLALAEPTQLRVCAWNGWKPRQYKDAGTELVKKKLLVEGKRERAGRTWFIKGGYSKGSGKNLPMEDWKQPFYGTIDRHVPVEPCHLLFARAWKRVEDGDKPT